MEHHAQYINWESYMEGGPIKWVEKQGLHQPAVHKQLYSASHVWIFPFPLLLSLLKLFTITILFYFQSLNYSYLNPQVLPLILLPHPPAQGLERGRLGECMMVLSCKLGLNHSNSLYIPRKNLSHHPQQLKLRTIRCFLLFKFLYREFLC